MQRVDSLEKTLIWKGLGAGGEGDDRGWDGWMASPTRWTWVWVNSRSWWWTGRPGVLWFMGSQRVRRDWATELNWTYSHCTRRGRPLLEEPEKRQKALDSGPLLQMGATSSSPILGSKQTPLVCILKNWKKFYPQALLKKHIFFFTKAWPQYDVSDGGKWPPEGSLNYNTILQLDLFCRWEGKWSEVPYIQVFFVLRENTLLCRSCGLIPSVMPIISPRPLGSNCLPYPGMPKPSLWEPPQFLVTSPAPAAAPILVAPNATPVISRLYSSLLPLQEVPNGDLQSMQVHVPFPLQDLRQIKLNLGSITEDPDNYRV